MRILLAAAAFLLTVVAALAESTEGTITNLDTTEMTVMLDDGKTYRLPPEMDVSVLGEGVEILIAFENGPDGVAQITDMEVLQ